MDKLVYIIILNWNGWQDTIECIESCLNLSYSNFRILTVDNGSNDGSERIIKKLFPGIEVIQTFENLGYAGGNNAGIRRALQLGADYIWLLNNDTVVDPEALSELVKTAEESNHSGVIGSKIYFYHEPKKIWFAGGLWQKNKLFPFQRGEGEVDEGQFNEICKVDYITGCSLLIKSSVIREVGLMDERYFLYWEDVDWNEKVVQHGWSILYVPRSMVWHKISSSIKVYSELQTRYFIRNALFFFRRHKPMRWIQLFIRIPLEGVVLFARGRKEAASGYLRGWSDYVINRSTKIC